MYDISSIKRATIKEVSGSFTLSRAKKRQRNLQNKWAARGKLLFFAN